MTEVTQILCEIEGGDLAAAERLLPLVYEELRRLHSAKPRGAKRTQCITSNSEIRTVD
jgi:hypothetical protein